MEDKKSGELYRKAIKDFPDYYKVVEKQAYPPKSSKETALKDLYVESKTPILPFEKLTDVVSRSAIDPESVLLSTYNKVMKRSEKPTVPALDTASSLRDVLGMKVGEEVLKRGIDPYKDIPGEKGYLTSLSKKSQMESPSLSGQYKVRTGNVEMRPGLSPEDYAGTYAHEIGHKKTTQGLGTEKKSKINVMQDILQTDYLEQNTFNDLLRKGLLSGEIPSESVKKAIESYQMDTPETFNPASLVDRYYRTHHRADDPTSWETEAIRNLQSKGILEEPFTPEARVKNIPFSTERAYYNLLKKRAK